MRINKNRFNRFISLSIACIMLAVAVPNAFAETTEEPFVLEEKYVESFNLLQAIGVYSQEYVASVKGDMVLTRGQFTKDLLLAMNLAESAGALKDRTTFMDIYDKETAGFANLAYDMGITKGTGYAMFEPDETIAIETATVMAMRALGYTFITNSNELIMKARLIGLLDGIEATGTLTATDAALLLYNALHAGSLRASIYDETSQGVAADSDWLELWFHINYVEGIVTATEVTGIQQNGVTAENRIRIGDKEVRGVPDGTEELLGYPARCYYTGNDIKEYVYITGFGFNYNETILKAEDVGSFTTTGISYYRDNNRTHNMTILPTADFVYNGKSVNLSEHTISEMKNGYTDVKLLDNNDDDRIDVVFITKSVTFAVDSVDTAKNRILSKDSQLIKLKDASDFIYTIYNADGTFAKLEDIKEWNVVTVTESFDKNYMVIRISTDSITGVIKSITKRDKAYINVDGQSFEILKTLLDDKEVKIGVAATFYLSVDGMVYAINYDMVSQGSWSYVVGIKSDNMFGGDYKLGCVIGTEPEYKIFETADRINVDGSSVKEDNLGSVLTSDKFPEVMMLSFNENNEITKINTIIKGSNESEEENIVKRYDGKTNPELYYSNWGKSFNAQFLLSGTATMYALPDNETDYDDVFKPEFKHEKTFDVDLYSIGVESPVCQMVVARGMALAGTAMSVDTGFVPFLHMAHEWDEVKEETVDVLYYLDNSNKEVGVKIPEDMKNVVLDASTNITVQNIIDSLERGDLIRFEKNSFGISNIEHIFDVSEKKLIAETKAFNGNFAPRFVAGQLYEAKDNYARIIVSSTYDPVAGIGIETHPRNADNKIGTILTLGDNDYISISTVASSVAIPGVNQGADDVYAVFQTRYGNPIFMMYIDYSNLNN